MSKVRFISDDCFGVSGFGIRHHFQSAFRGSFTLILSHISQLLCGFAMETENLISNSRAKLTKKNLDMIAANNLKVAGAGFGVDTNVVTILTADGIQELPLMGKDQVAAKLLDAILETEG